MIIDSHENRAGSAGLNMANCFLAPECAHLFHQSNVADSYGLAFHRTEYALARHGLKIGRLA